MKVDIAIRPNSNPHIFFSQVLFETDEELRAYATKVMHFLEAESITWETQQHSKWDFRVAVAAMVGGASFCGLPRYMLLELGKRLISYKKPAVMASPPCLLDYYRDAYAIAEADAYLSSVGFGDFYFTLEKMSIKDMHYLCQAVYNK